MPNDLDRLGMFGYSAGGHLSALVAALADEPIAIRAAASDWSETDARWKQLPTIHAVCAGGPPCDFRSLPIDNTSLAYFLGGSRREKSAAYIAASPAAHISSSDPVTQIIHGDSDLLVPIAGSRQFHQAQLAAGVDSRLEVECDEPEQQSSGQQESLWTVGSFGNSCQQGNNRRAAESVIQLPEIGRFTSKSPAREIRAGPFFFCSRQ
jgi:hypothetical protein